jgi:gamma-glutamyltranspeptidase / glutathione hydrolase
MKTIGFTILALLINTTFLFAQDRLSGRSFATRSEVIAQNGMVATNHPIATQIGVEILKKGGSAIDAAIAANAFLGLADPAMNGIGGDLFAIVWDAKTQKLYGLNASGRSPKNLTLEYLKSQKEKGNTYYTGPLSVTTPGCIDGWFTLHKKFGKLEMPILLQPAIHYAREGVAITQETADVFKLIETSIQASDNPTFKSVYFTNDHFPRKGDIFKNPYLANTLEIISKKGRDGFYKGEVAEKIAKHQKNTGGFLTTKDLLEHKSEWVEPVTVNYRGYDIWELPPNGQGMSVLQILNILEGFNISEMGYGSPDHLHHLVEAKKLAYEDMAKFYGDPAFGKIPFDKLLSKEYGAERAALINSDRSGIYQPGLESGDHTIYLSVADKEGNMISFIQSNANLFGSKEVPKGLGFALQNRGGGFILEENHINTFIPGKRPFHTIIPAFVTKNNKPFMSFGVMGGDMQPIGHVQILLNIIDFGMNLQEAGDAPRIYHNGTIMRNGHLDGVGDTYIESGFSYETISKLMDKGHNIRMKRLAFGGYQGIMIKNGVYYGASESRKDGQAAGY